MNKKEKFIKLVELESQMKAKGNPRYRKNVVKNTYLAMIISKDEINDIENLYEGVIEFVDLLSGEVESLEWLSDDTESEIKKKRGI